jgi:hypothetical protein
LIGVALTFLHLIGIFSFFETFEVYAADGWGIKVFGVLGSMCKTASEVVLIVVLLLMASGWTISFQSLPRIHRYIIPIVVAFYCLVSLVLYVWSECKFHFFFNGFSWNSSWFHSIPLSNMAWSYFDNF